MFVKLQPYINILRTASAFQPTHVHIHNNQPSPLSLSVFIKFLQLTIQVIVEHLKKARQL